ncbi:MAG: DUF4932 domain-containing protein [Cyclobacteriaceae bacterium]
MKLPISLFAVASGLLSACTHHSEDTTSEASYPEFIKTEADSFAVKGNAWEVKFAIGERDTIAPGTDGYEGGLMWLATQEDTLEFEYTSTPYRQHHTISVISPQDTTVCIIRFNQHTAEYSDTYIEKAEGNVQFVIPEVYELANIIWTLSPSGQQASNLRKEGAYYQDVMDHFAPYLDHPIFNDLQLPDSVYFQQYYSFRENSVCFQFEGDSLKYNGPYYHVSGNFNQFGGLFKELQSQVEDFAKTSDFKTFYQNHLPYYEQLIVRQQELMPVKEMWAWLEQEFPQKMDAYKVVFSPLIGASHSTQKFGFKGNRDAVFWEALMFTSGPERLDENEAMAEPQKEGLHSGVVFTEIDHNYVNPVSYQYREEIEKIFDDRAIWTKTGGDTGLYDNPLSVFNEYMTHAVFCLYVQDTYDEEAARFIINEREKLMIDRRHYTKFSQFNEKLAALYEQKSDDEKVIDLYPGILAWARNIQ